MRKFLIPFVTLFLTFPLLVGSRSLPSRSGSNRTHSNPSYSVQSRRSSTPKVYRSRSSPQSSIKCLGCARDKRGRIKRSASARNEFKGAHACPTTGKTSGGCPGYVIDHIVPLKRGGSDHPSNMQWQTKAAAKAKDRIE
jgi:hypothetical protein